MKPNISLFLFVLAALLLTLFYQNELLLTVIIAIITTLILASDRWQNARHFGLVLVVGGLCENIAVALGAWKYSNASYLFTPLWLVIGWGISIVLLEEAFVKKDDLKFSKFSPILAFSGVMLTGILYRYEILLLVAFIFATLVFIFSGYYRKSEIWPAVFAALFGTLMEAVNIFAGNWHYSAAIFAVPLWLPFCWFNAFLIMRRIIRFGE